MARPAGSSCELCIGICLLHFRFGFGVAPMPDVQRRWSCAAAGEASTARTHIRRRNLFAVTAAAFSVGLPLILPGDAQKLLDSGSGDALLMSTGRDC
jgi:hypothetical protein